MRGARNVILGLGLYAAMVTSLFAQGGSKRIVGESTLPFSPAVVAGDFVYVSGSLSTSGDVSAQTRQILDNQAALLDEAGSSIDRAAWVFVYLKNPEDFQAMNEVFRSVWPTAAPARSTIQADLVRPEALVEISMVAIRDGAERVVVHPEGWPSGTTPYSYGIKSGDTLFMAGLISRDPVEGTPVGGGIQTEVRTILDNAGAILGAAGMTHDDVVSARVYFTDPSVFGEMNEAYRSYFGDIPPARAAVRTALMGPSYGVEITLVAVAGEKERIIRPNPDGSPGRPSATLSHAVRVGDRLYLSGMLGSNDETRGDPAAQTALTMDNLGRTLQAAGFEWEHVVDSLVYLTDLENYAAMNEAYRGIIREGFPARATVRTDLVNAAGLVEIMMVAVR